VAKRVQGLGTGAPKRHIDANRPRRLPQMLELNPNATPEAPADLIKDGSEMTFMQDVIRNVAALPRVPGPRVVEKLSKGGV